MTQPEVVQLHYKRIDAILSVAAMQTELEGLEASLRKAVILHALANSPYQFSWSCFAKQFKVPREEWPGQPHPGRTTPMSDCVSAVKVNWSKMSPQEVWDALKSAPKVAGPWTEHVHSFGCDCGSYRPGSPYHGTWYYRPGLTGGEVVTAWDSETKKHADRDLRAQGYVLVEGDAKS